MLNEGDQRNLSAESDSLISERTNTRLESPLVGLMGQGARWAAHVIDRISLTELPFLDLVSLRGNARDSAFIAAVEGALVCAIPVAPNTFIESATHRIFWRGPDEWLVQSKQPQPQSCELGLQTGLADSFACAVDVSSGYTVIRVSGIEAQALLARGCPLDLHPAVFGVGQCAQSHFFKASILIAAVEPDVFDLVVRRSFAEYVALMLLDAAESIV